MNLPRSLLAWVMAVSVTACVGGQPAQRTEGDSQVRQLAVAGQCGYAAPDLVYMDSRSRLDQVGSRRGVSLAPLDDHDFSHEHLLLVAAGRKPTGGYGMVLKESRIHDDTLEITVKVEEPGPDQMVTQALTSPCMLLAVPAEGWERARVSGPGLPELSIRR